MKKIFLIIIFCIVFIGEVHADTLQYGNWTPAGPVPPFGPREFYGSTVFHNQIFVIGGKNSSPETPDPQSIARYNDVWSTSDGRNWTERTANAGFSPRSDLRVAVFNDKLWVIGGRDDRSNRLNDVWSSSDGSNWRLVTANAGFSPRGDPVVVVFDNKLWVIGGRDEKTHRLNDVWSSSDGSNWARISDNAGFNQSPGFYLSGAVFYNRIFIFAVVPNQESWGTNQVWSSSEGKNWTLVNDNAPFEVREYMPVTVFNDRLWIVGGGNEALSLVTMDMAVHPENYFYFNSVWSSADGNNWTLETEHAGFNPRYGMGVVTFHDKIWVLGGYPQGGDVWYLPLSVPSPAPPAVSLSSTTSAIPAVSGSTAQAGIDPLMVCFSLLIAFGVGGSGIRRR
jgi:hypothetical protein